MVPTEEDIASKQGKAKTYLESSLSTLISEDRKLKEAERLKTYRAQVRRPLVVGRNEEDHNKLGNISDYKVSCE